MTLMIENTSLGTVVTMEIRLHLIKKSIYTDEIMSTMGP